MTPKYSTYELKLSGDLEDIALLRSHLPATFSTIAEANAKRRAILELFEGMVACEIISVQRIPPKTRRRTLRLR